MKGITERILLQSQEDPEVKTKRRECNCSHQLRDGLDCETDEVQES